jgi:hypothetical protein
MVVVLVVALPFVRSFLSSRPPAQDSGCCRDALATREGRKRDESNDSPDYSKVRPGGLGRLDYQRPDYRILDLRYIITIIHNQRRGDIESDCIIDLGAT